MKWKGETGKKEFWPKRMKEKEEKKEEGKRGREVEKNSTKYLEHEPEK